MRSKIVINSNVGISKKELLAWSAISLKNSEILHHGRNMVRLIKMGPLSVTIKLFSQSLKNRIVYAFRKSKARKSFENALVLIERGIHTPLPYGYIEQRSKLGFLLRSEYFSHYEYRMTLYEAILRYGRKCLAAFADFVATLHVKGIRHDDLNNSNVRVKVEDDGHFIFSLIDLNRMKIYKLGQFVPDKECFRNICRFCSLDNDYIYFVMKYIESREMASDNISTVINTKKRHDNKIDAKKWFKQLITLQYI